MPIKSLYAVQHKHYILKNACEVILNANTDDFTRTQN